MKDNLKRRRPQGKTTLIEGNLNGRQPQWKTNLSIKEDDLKGRMLLLKNILMEVDLNGSLTGSR